MPRASWKGFLRLSLVSCPIYVLGCQTWCRQIDFVPVVAADRAPVVRTTKRANSPVGRFRVLFSEDIRGDAAEEPPSPTRVAPADWRHAALSGRPIERATAS